MCFHLFMTYFSVLIKEKKKTYFSVVGEAIAFCSEMTDVEEPFGSGSGSG